MAEPLVMMKCDRNGATLTTRGCAAMFRSAAETKPEPWQSKFACRGCPIGAVNAGVAVAVANDTAAMDEARRCCPRCDRLAPRLINGHLCITCYNRQLDVVRGFNRRGNRPGLADRLHPVTMMVRGARLRQVRFELVLGNEEAIHRVAMVTPGPFFISPAPFAPYPGWQQALPLLNASPARRRARHRPRGTHARPVRPAAAPRTFPLIEWAQVAAVVAVAA